MRDGENENLGLAAVSANRQCRNDGGAVPSRFFAAASVLLGPEIGIADDGAAFRKREIQRLPLANAPISARNLSGVSAARNAC
jgi:hypothetical protein